MGKIKKSNLGKTLALVAGMMTMAPYNVLADSQLPKPPAGFKGEINTTVLNSKPDWPDRPTAPKNAPNIVLIMTDDVGFSAGSTWGGPVNTPVQDRLAERGLRYNQFHTTAVSSPTRAALLTGRNHHTAHTGGIMEASLGYPGYDTLLGKDMATIAEILRLSGYNTAWFGKDHNVPDFENNSIIGPHDRWPTGLGFEKFYGFLGGESDQYSPYLLYDGTQNISPYIDNPKYNLNEDLSKQAKNWIRQQKSLAPDKPFFVYYVPGGTHAPHQVPLKWSNKYKGKFDKGWDAVREETLARQKKKGIVPENTKLTPRPEQIPAWDSLSDAQKKLYARQMEVYAGYLEQTDHEIGQMLKAIEDMGEMDNTVVIYIQGDNGASGEGALTGSENENYVFNAQVEKIEDIDIAKLGTPEAYNHYSAGWALAMDTPFQWMKQVASHFGGTRNGMVISWPKGIKSKGEIRSQFHHVIDIAPTLLDIVGIEQPDKVNDVKQKPMEGVSMTYSFKDKKAESNHKKQYFEIMGFKGLYLDGWMLSATPQSAPWEQGKKDGPLSSGWELYNIKTDFSQAYNLAEQYPDKVQQMAELFEVEAGKHNVYPLLVNSRTFLVIDTKNRPNINEGRTKFTYTGVVDHISEGIAPNFRNTSFDLEAEIDFAKDVVPNGMILTMGGRFGGFGFWIESGVVKFGYRNPRYDDYYEIKSDKAIDPGQHKIKLEFKSDFADTKKPGAGGLATIYVDGKKVGEGRIEKTIPFRFGLSEAMDVGCDYGTSITSSYKAPFIMNGDIKKVEVMLKK